MKSIVVALFLMLVVSCGGAGCPSNPSPSVTFTKQELRDEFAQGIRAYDQTVAEPRATEQKREMRRLLNASDVKMKRRFDSLKDPTGKVRGGGATIEEISVEMAEQLAKAKRDLDAANDARAAAAQQAAKDAELDRLKRDEEKAAFLKEVDKKIKKAGLKAAPAARVDDAGPRLLRPTHEEIVAKRAEAARGLALWAAPQGLRVMEVRPGVPVPVTAEVVQRNKFRRKSYPGFFLMKYWVDEHSGTIYYLFEPFKL